MKSAFGVFLKFLGFLVLLTIVVLVVTYQILFDHEMKYYPVEDPVVSKNLEDWQSRKFGSDASIEWEKSGREIKIFIPELMRKNPPCDFAWVFKIS